MIQQIPITINACKAAKASGERVMVQIGGSRKRMGMLSVLGSVGKKKTQYRTNRIAPHSHKSGTPRVWLRRPSAKATPRGNERTIPKTVIIVVSRNPPQ